LTIRKATVDDAAGIAALLGGIAAERVHSAIDRAWNQVEQRNYLASMSPREAIHMAEDGGVVVGAQTLELWSPLESMRHVGQLGTFVAPEWRGRGVGRELWSRTAEFARLGGYRKLVIQVRGSNAAAQAFYRRLGFVECGRLSRQVVIDGLEDDEVLFELFV
jgi:ribosomal protein S18 acetylase RimI-like enzyme